MASGTTTVGALPYPVSTDAPNVHTDVQALAQALANRLATPTARAASATMAYGELAVSTASPITLTLPSAAANAKVGVFAKVATAANPVTISSGSSNIYGLGLNGVSSLVLGSIGAFVVLQSDGTNWFVIAGEQDTGWVALTLGTGVATASGAYAPSARLVGSRVALSGTLTNSGSALTNGATIFTVPAALKPASAVFLSTTQDFQSVTASKAYPLQLLTASGNALAASTADGTFANSALIPLDGLGYRLN